MQVTSSNVHFLAEGMVLIQDSIFSQSFTCRVERINHDQDSVAIQLLHFSDEKASMPIAYYPPVHRKLSEMVASKRYQVPNSEALKALKIRPEASSIWFDID